MAMGRQHSFLKSTVQRGLQTTTPDWFKVRMPLTNSPNPPIFASSTVFFSASNPSASVFSPSLFRLFNVYSLLVMTMDVLPSCSAPHDTNFMSQLIEKLAAASILSSAGSLCSSTSASSSSVPSSSTHPPSPPPSGAARNFNQLSGARSKRFDSAAAVPGEFHSVQNAIAVAVLVRLHQWCCRLFWLTIVCLMSYYSDQQQNQRMSSGGNAENGDKSADDGGAAERQRRTFREVRKSIVQATQRHGSKKVTDLEMQLLRHLTCPQTAVLRPLRPFHHKKRHFLSRPPSPQLFDISEENDEQQQ
ncbi:hypothetical protein niasHS_004263 [Heterodera schachtii]|uniref:Uncharacterized protein n=1 Tax=Heterodera schachtii TaxID=97005 RepID=A0ABD2JKK1_HETSC